MNGSGTLLAVASGTDKNRRTTGEILRRIYDGAHPASLFVEKARNLRHQLQLGPPPIDPWEIASRLNIQVKERSMALDGYIEKSEDDSFVIFVRREAALPRKRFTICHEIAHTFFFDILADQRKFRQREQNCFGSQDDPEEEWLCDVAAAEMLMPFSLFNSDITAAQRAGGLTPNIMLKLRARYQVSLRAVASRIAWVSRNTTCALWEKRGPAINIIWAAPSKARSLVLCQTGRSSVEMAAEASDRTVLTANDSFYIRDDRTRLIRRKTSSRRLGPDTILSVLAPTTLGFKGSNLSATHRAQLRFRFE